MGHKLKHAPVYFVIAQVRFNPILSLDTFAPKIQEMFRHQGFPGFEKGVLSSVVLNPFAASETQSSPLPTQLTTRYTFSNLLGTSCFILDQGSLSYQTTTYDVFETFSGRFMDALRDINRVLQLSYTDIVGVRYLDAIAPKAGENLSEYLDTAVLGLTKHPGDQLIVSFSETRLRIGEVNVIARVVVQDSGLAFPPDLMPLKLNVEERFKEISGIHAIMDTDAGVQLREPFDMTRIEAHLNATHQQISRVFLGTVTKYALSTWGKDE